MFTGSPPNVPVRAAVAGFSKGTQVLSSFRAIRRTFPSSREPVAPGINVRGPGCAAIGPGVKVLTPSGRGTTDTGTRGSCRVTVVPGVGALYTSGRPVAATGVGARSLLNRALVRSRAF